MESSLLSSNEFNIVSLANVISIRVLAVNISNSVRVLISTVCSCSEREFVLRALVWIVERIISGANRSCSALAEIVFSNHVFAARPETTGTGCVDG